MEKANLRMPWGKYQDRLIKNMIAPEEVQYLNWLRQSKFWGALKKDLQECIIIRLDGKH